MSPDNMPQQISEDTASSCHPSGAEGQDQELLPLVQWRVHRTIHLPPCYWEDIPQPLASLPLQQPNLLEDVDVALAGAIKEPVLPLEVPLPEPSKLRMRMCRLDSPHNTFQVF